jgi:hypothetical protein
MSLNPEYKAGWSLPSACPWRTRTPFLYVLYVNPGENVTEIPGFY